MKIELIREEANHGRTKTAVIEQSNCDVCGKLDDCLMTDSSEGEYGDVAICKLCILRVLEHMLGGGS